MKWKLELLATQESQNAFGFWTAGQIYGFLTCRAYIGKSRIPWGVIWIPMIRDLGLRFPKSEGFVLGVLVLNINIFGSIFGPL